MIRIRGPRTAPRIVGNQTSRREIADEKLSLLIRWPPAGGGVSSSDLNWLEPLAASRHPPAGEAAARHGACSRSGEDPDAAEPRA